MPLPNFIVFGAIKSGTGAIYQYLEHHPQIYMSPVKEPRYFSTAKWTHKTNGGKTDRSYKERLDEYLQYFEGAKNEKAIGEASSNYINSAGAALRIKETLPNVKLIASLRNPVDRAYAHFRMVSKSQTNVDFSLMGAGKNQGWATTSLYYEQLKQYYELFNSKQIKILIFEDWTLNLPRVLEDIYTFLGVDNTFKISPKIEYTPAEVAWPGLSKKSVIRRLKPYIPRQILIKTNKIKRKLTPRSPPLPDQLRRDMLKWYYDDIIKLQFLIKMDLSIWLK